MLSESEDARLKIPAFVVLTKRFKSANVADVGFWVGLRDEVIAAVPTPLHDRCPATQTWRLLDGVH